MKTGKTSLLGRLSGVFSIALVALAFSIGGSYVVRAEQPETLPSTLREMVFVPIMRAVQGLEQRLTGIETSMAAFAESFTSQRITTRRLCVSDDSGSQTCITKEQLDALLKRIAQADPGQPTVSVTVADPAPAVESTETTAATNKTPFAPNAVPEKASDDTSEPTTTGSLNVEPDGAALVWYPDVEISIAAAAQSEE